MTVFLLGYLGALFGLVAVEHLHAAVPFVVILLSVVTFALYAVDKAAARRGAWRTPESTLHFLALFGGWPGALLAQGWLRHKTSKRSFLQVFWVTVFVNLVLVGWLATEPSLLDFS